MAKISQILRSHEEIEEFLIENLDLDDAAFQSIKRFTILSINSCENMTELCSKLSNLTSEKFGGVWQCFVYKEFLGSFKIRHKNNKFAYFTVCGLSFVIFQES